MLGTSNGTRTAATAAALALALTGGACSGAPSPTAVGSGEQEVAAFLAPTTTTTATPPSPEVTDVPTSATPPTTVATSAPPSTGAPVSASAPPRQVYVQEWAPMAVVGELVLVHPSTHVERIGFHESNHDGARQMQPLPSAAGPMTLESRNRGTGSHTAADVVVHPEGEIRAPVTGVVKRSGTYVLYCDTTDDYAVIEPDARPGYEVKVLHIDGVQVRPGDRVVAGETVLAPRPTQLPFESQVDEFTAEPSWPHAHIEVVDTAIPDKPNPGGGGGCP